MRLRLLLIILCISPVAHAGRHAISREVAHAVVEARFAQFYQDEARQKQIEAEAMQREIIKAEELERLAFDKINRGESEKYMSSDELLSKAFDDVGATNSSGGNPLSYDAATGHSGFSDYGASSLKSSKVNSSGTKSMYESSPVNGEFSYLSAQQGASNSSADIVSLGSYKSLDALSQEEKLNEVVKLASVFAQGGQDINEAISLYNQLNKISPEMALLFKKELKDKYNIDLKIDKKLSANKSSSINSLPTQTIKDKCFDLESVFKFKAGKLFDIYSAVGKATTIILDDDEKLASDPILGDSDNWDIIVKDYANKSIVIINPFTPMHSTNLTLLTSKGRVYNLRLNSQKTNFMATVKWKY